MCQLQGHMCWDTMSHNPFIISFQLISDLHQVHALFATFSLLHHHHYFLSSSLLTTVLVLAPLLLHLDSQCPFWSYPWNSEFSSRQCSQLGWCSFMQLPQTGVFKSMILPFCILQCTFLWH